MTDPPQGRDRSPSVAALAVAVNGLRRQVETLAAKVDKLTSTQQEQEATLEDADELRHQVDKILAILTGQDEASPAGWSWLTMSDQVRDEKFSELSDWVETVYREQYPGYLASQVRPCWPAQPPRSQVGTSLALPALDPHLPRQTPSPQRRRRLARPLVPRRPPPPRRHHEPMRRNLPAPARPHSIHALGHRAPP